MNLVQYEIRMRHVDGPDFDWWAKGDQRVSDFALLRVLAYMDNSESFRNVTHGPDPHDDHSAADIDYGMTGMYVDCKVPGCTWTKDYD